MSDRPVVDFYYCCSCPWSYLALVRLQETAMRAGAAIAYRPIVADWLPGGGERLDVRGAATCSPAAAYMHKDLQDWARFCGVRIRLPAGRIQAEWAARGAVVAIEAGRIGAYATAIFQALFGEARDISDRAVVLETAARCGLPVESFESRLSSPDVLGVVQRNSATLTERGGFASPTLFYGDDMYYGHERIPLLESALMQAGDRPFIAPGEHGR